MFVQVRNSINIAIKQFKIEIRIKFFIYQPQKIYETKIKVEIIFNKMVLPTIEFYLYIIFRVYILNKAIVIKQNFIRP